MESQRHPRAALRVPGATLRLPYNSRPRLIQPRNFFFENRPRPRPEGAKTVPQSDGKNETRETKNSPTGAAGPLGSEGARWPAAVFKRRARRSSRGAPRHRPGARSARGKQKAKTRPLMPAWPASDKLHSVKWGEKALQNRDHEEDNCSRPPHHPVGNRPINKQKCGKNHPFPQTHSRDSREKSKSYKRENKPFL